MWRIILTPLLTKYISYKTWLIIGFLSWAMFVLASMLEDIGVNTLSIMLENIGMSIIGVVFILSTFMLIVDVLTLFGSIFSSKAQMFRYNAFVFGVLASIFAHIQGLRQPIIVSYEVGIPDLNEALDGIKIVALADTHLGKTIGAKWLSKVVLKTMNQKPDMIVLLGDIFEDEYPVTEEIKELFNQLSAPLGVWAVVGNHDDNKRFDNKFPIEHTSVNLLFNESKEITKGLIIVGVEDFGWRQQNSDAVDKTLKNRPEGTTIYLSHAPLKYEEAAHNGVNLMLSGHTHAGQIWPFGYLVKRSYPLHKGEYDVNGMTLIVSRGTGTWGPRMRLWERGEISEIILRKATPQK